MRVHAFLVLVSAGLSGCSLGSSYAEPSFASAPSSYSSGSSYSAAPSQPGIPQRDVSSGAFVVRPDTLVLPFALHIVHNNAGEAVTLLRKSADALGTQFRNVAGAAAVLRMRGIAVQPAGRGKVDEGEGSSTVSVLVDGVVEVSLPPERDYWDRGRLLANLSALIKTQHKPGKDRDGEVSVRCDTPRAIVKNPEAYRAKLTEDWVKQARALATAAQSATVPLHLVDCAPPGEIVQTAISFEEVVLSLKTSCRLDAVLPGGQGSALGGERPR